jgi:hypothetical protein
LFEKQEDAAVVEASVEALHGLGCCLSPVVLIESLFVPVVELDPEDLKSLWKLALLGLV